MNHFITDKKLVKCRICYKETGRITVCDFALEHYESEAI